MGENSLLQPGVSIKPLVTKKDVEKILFEEYNFVCISIKELNGYDDSNYHVKVQDSKGFVFKVVNSLDSKNPHLFEAQNSLLLYLGGRGIVCPTPIKTKNGQYFFHKKFDSGQHIVRLLEFIDGTILHHGPNNTMGLFYEVGYYVATLDEAMKGFHHEVYDSHKTIWMMESVPELSQFLYVIPDVTRRTIIEEVINQFSSKVVPAIPHLEKGMIHGDFNEQNILIAEDNEHWSIKAILDFGDSQFSCYLFELAVTMTYMMVQGRDVAVGGHVLGGYTSVRKLTTQEESLLLICICSRLCQSLVLGAYSSLQDPENEYILTTAKPGWALLEELWKRQPEEVLNEWKRISENL